MRRTSGPCAPTSSRRPTRSSTRWTGWARAAHGARSARSWEISSSRSSSTPSWRASWASSRSPTWRPPSRTRSSPVTHTSSRARRSAAPRRCSRTGPASRPRSDGASTAREGSVLDGVPCAAPALLRAERLTEKASRIGFDWPDLSGCPGQAHRGAGGARGGARLEGCPRHRARARRRALQPRQPRALHRHAGRGRAPGRERPLHPALPRGRGGSPRPAASHSARRRSPRWRRSGRRPRPPRPRFRRLRRRRAPSSPIGSSTRPSRRPPTPSGRSVAPALGWTVEVDGGDWTVETPGLCFSYAPGPASTVTLSRRRAGRRRRGAGRVRAAGGTRSLRAPAGLQRPGGDVCAGCAERACAHLSSHRSCVESGENAVDRDKRETSGWRATGRAEGFSAEHLRVTTPR